MATEDPDFEGSVLSVLQRLPEGRVISYGELAAAAGHQGAARAVGNLLRSTGEPVPWWRVVRADGRLGSPDVVRQARKLREEGVSVLHGRVIHQGNTP
jgi:alkylated DNA nucleotide flippase Atl1